MATTPWRDHVVHLRLHFQLLLAPIYLWGFFLGHGRPGAPFWLGFLAFHVFLYGGTTAFNSWYDRDTGPVGGLRTPPAVPRGLLRFSLLVQAVGAVLAAWVGWPFFGVYAGIFLLATAYSHPRVRLKARPLAGLVTVAFGQGFLAALGGWLAAEPHLRTLQDLPWLGALAVTLVTGGFYPLTQIYQTAEDAARGDRTFAVWAGVRGTFRFALITQALGAAMLVAVLARELDVARAGLVAAFYAVLLGVTVRWARRFDPARVHENFSTLSLVHALTSGGFLLFLAWHVFA